jgi:LysR substrate binding domain
MRRVQAAQRGEVGTIAMAYTLTTAWDTIPVLLAHLGERFPDINVNAREVFGCDITDSLVARHYDVAVVPMTSYPRAFRKRPIRRERLQAALGHGHELAQHKRVELSRLRDERFEIWPREMAPAFYDAVVGACRAAGFEPELDEHAAGTRSGATSPTAAASGSSTHRSASSSQPASRSWNSRVPPPPSPSRPYGTTRGLTAAHANGPDRRADGLKAPLALTGSPRPTRAHDTCSETRLERDRLSSLNALDSRLYDRTVVKVLHTEPTLWRKDGAT